MNKKSDKQVHAMDFSLVTGGPLYQLYLKTRLLKKPLLSLNRRIIAIPMLAWLPLLILTVIGGVAFDGVRLPFIRDIDVHVRFLIVLAMLISGEVIAHTVIPLIVEQFLKCNIITSDLQPRYNQIISSAVRLRNSVVAELTLIVLVYTLGRWISSEYIPFGLSSWYARSTGDSIKLTPAGYWYVYVSLPLFQFILLRWYYKMAIWYRFLWQVSRLPLKLNSLHPDRSGGLGFLSKSVYAFEPFLLAHSVLLTGMIFNRIWNTGAALSSFQNEILGVVGFVIILALFPLLFFMFQMAREKQIGTLSYDVVANQYVDSFRMKWISSTSRKSEGLLGTSDIQSLADLGNSFTVSSQMRITPFGSHTLVSIIVMTALPLIPLVFTILPFERIIGQIFGLIF